MVTQVNTHNTNAQATSIARHKGLSNEPILTVTVVDSVRQFPSHLARVSIYKKIEWVRVYS